MSTRSRTAFVVIVVAVAIPFFVLWIRTMIQSWNEAKMMSFVENEDRERYEETVQETKNAFGGFKNVWDRVKMPPSIKPTAPSAPVSTLSTTEAISTETVKNIEQQLQTAVDQSK